MEDIKPSKVIVTNEALKSDTAEIRGGYDPRIIPPDQLPDDATHYMLFNFFGEGEVDRRDMRQNEKLKNICHWAMKQSKSRDRNQIYHELVQLEAKLGTPRLGETRLDRVHNYISLTGQIEDLEIMRDNLMRR